MFFRKLSIETEFSLTKYLWGVSPLITSMKRMFSSIDVIQGAYAPRSPVTYFASFSRSSSSSAVAVIFSEALRSTMFVPSHVS